MPNLPPPPLRLEHPITFRYTGNGCFPEPRDGGGRLPRGGGEDEAARVVVVGRKWAYCYATARSHNCNSERNARNGSEPVVTCTTTNKWDCIRPSSIVLTK